MRGKSQIFYKKKERKIMIKLFKENERYFFQENENEIIELTKFNEDKRNPENSIFFILPENSLNKKSFSKKKIDEKLMIEIDENSKREYSKKEKSENQIKIRNKSYNDYLSDDEKKEIEKLSLRIEEIRNLGKKRLEEEEHKRYILQEMNKFSKEELMKMISEIYN
jgi:hypothetical protein